MPSATNVKEYWEGQARLARSEFRGLQVLDAAKNVFADAHGGGTLKDATLRQLEIDALARWVAPDADAIDLGCGNGFATYQIAQATSARFLGVDYSPEMIANADRLSDSAPAVLRERVRFAVGDGLRLEDSVREPVDVLITQRCLINVTDWALQQQAIASIAKVVKPGGVAALLEGSVEGLANLNAARAGYGLDPIPVVWHNLFFHDDQLVAAAAPWFDLIEIDRFSSMYMLASRALHPALVAPEQPQYGARINDLAASLPNCGDWGYLKIYAFRRK